MILEAKVIRTITITDAKAKLSELINQVLYKKEKIYISRKGKQVALLIPVENNDKEEKEGLIRARGVLSDLDSEVDGIDVENGKEEVLGIGPGLLWSINPDNHLFFNAYWETAVESRPEGQRLNLRWVHHF